MPSPVIPADGEVVSRSTTMAENGDSESEADEDTKLKQESFRRSGSPYDNRLEEPVRDPDASSTPTGMSRNGELAMRPDESEWHHCCTRLFFTRAIDTFLLMTVIIIQGSLLNYLLIWHRQQTHSTYMWFLADFIVVLMFVGALTSSYQKLSRKLRLKSKFPFASAIPMYGALPLGYMSWFAYAVTLSAKIIVITKTEIINNLGNEGFFDPPRLKVVLAAASLVFLLLVNAHHDADPLSDLRAYIITLVTSTAFEIFDAVAFLDLLFVTESRIILPYPLENSILALVTLNLMLPTLSLLKLSLADFGERDRPITISLVGSTLKLLAIEVPYLTIRIYLWNVYSHNSNAIFLMKNILMIAVKLRYLLPEYAAVIIHEFRKKSKPNGSGQLELRSVS